MCRGAIEDPVNDREFKKNTVRGDEIKQDPVMILENFLYQDSF
jgi:hypothetical protein